MDDQRRKYYSRTKLQEQESRSREQPHQHQRDPSSSIAWIGSSQRPVQNQEPKQTKRDARPFWIRDQHGRHRSMGTETIASSMSRARDKEGKIVKRTNWEEDQSNEVESLSGNPEYTRTDHAMEAEMTKREKPFVGPPWIIAA
eukprot:3588517-Amphidinium_carterae.1